MGIILASASPRRKQILRRLGYKFKIIVPDVDEKSFKCAIPAEFAKRLAAAKAEKVAGKVDGGVIIAADTIVVCEGEVLGKPKDIKDSERILRKLSGSKHRVITGFCVVDQARKKIHKGHCTSVVYFRNIPDSEIHSLAKKHMDKAGAYSIQSKEDRFAVKVVGSFDNVVGFPTEKITALLDKLGCKRPS